MLFFVFQLLVELLPAHFAGLLVAPINIESFFNFAALLRDFGFDAIDFVAHVYAIGHGAFIVVFHHKVLIEKSDGLFGRRGSETNQKGIEVFEHLPPKAIDGTVAFVGDDKIKGFERNGGVVGNVFGAVVGLRNFKA